MEAETIAIGDRQWPVWPPGQEVKARDDERLVLTTRFADHGGFHPMLLRAIEQRVADPAVSAQYSRALGGIKIYGLERSRNPAVQLLNARAAALFKLAVGADRCVIDIGWANVYRKGDYISAHSHIRAHGSVVYCLDAGEADPEDKHAGQLCFVDPRYPPCCKIRSDCMTNPQFLNMRPGTMVIFPGKLVHTVPPYGGARPRVTLAWNINQERLEGDTLSMMNLSGAELFDPA